MRTVLWSALVLMVVACGTKDKAATIPIGNGQNGSGGDTGVDGDTGSGGDPGSGGTDTTDATAPDTGEQGEACGGLMSCKPGEYCCDGSCGACAPIGTNCPIDPCHTDGAVAE